MYLPSRWREPRRARPLVLYETVAGEIYRTQAPRECARPRGDDGDLKPIAGGHAFKDFDSAIYFSSVTYTTVGYGDLLLPEPWRLAGGIEALTGILMCGWSAASFFSVVSRMRQR